MNRLQIIGVAFFFLTTGIPDAEAQRLSSVFAGANEAFAQGRAEEAVNGYERLIEAGVRDADVFHNLGTALATDERYGEAILAFERALFLNPGAEDTIISLASTRRVLAGRLTASRGEVETQESAGLGEALVRDISEGALATTFLVFWALVFLGLVFGRARPQRRLVAGLVCILAAFGALTVGTLLLAKRGAFLEGEAAIITACDSELLEGPDPRSVPRGDAYEGERARVLRRDESYVFVRMSDGRSGWLPAPSVGLVDAS